MKTVMIVAGESSGELYGSLLAKTLRSTWADVRLIGIGGERMREAGVELLSGISGSFGLTEALLSLKRIRESLNRASRALTEFSPDVVVLIDFPDFNFRLARVAKRHGYKVLYYVSPQVWAWRKGRVKTMGEIADRVAVILPFEEEIYRKAGIQCEFVGHPAMEEIEEYETINLNVQGSSAPADKVKIEGKSQIKDKVISLLPGSRPHEMKTLLPVFVDLVKIIKDELGDARFIMPLAPNVEPGRFGEYINPLEKSGVTVVKGKAINALASSDMAVIASGTATLQAALLGVPMVVVYRLSPLTYFLGKKILDVKYISLVNILSGEEVVPELIQHMATADNIMEQLRRILYDDSYRSRMMLSFGKIRKAFSHKRPSHRVAEMIGEMAGWAPEKMKF